MLKFIISLTILSFSVSSYALNIKQMKKMKYWKQQLAEYQPRLKKACGKEIPVKMDKSMAAPFLTANKSASGYCEAVLDGIKSTCGSDEDVKAIVNDSVQSVVCTLNTKDKKGMKFTFKGKTLVAEIGIESSNIWKKTQEWLENNLGE